MVGLFIEKRSPRLESFFENAPDQPCQWGPWWLDCHLSAGERSRIIVVSFLGFNIDSTTGQLGESNEARGQFCICLVN